MLSISVISCGILLTNNYVTYYRSVSPGKSVLSYQPGYIMDGLYSSMVRSTVEE